MYKHVGQSDLYDLYALFFVTFMRIKVAYLYAISTQSG